MFDRALRRLIDPALNAAARRLARRGVTADCVTWIGFGFGALAVVLLAVGALWLGMAAFLVNRLADGLDGALARLRQPTDRGGFLDIVCDFLVYAGLAFAFAVAKPDDARAAAFLLFSFFGTGGTFLAFAIFAAKRQLQGLPTYNKAFYYLGGLMEGGETAAFFVFVCLFPEHFAVAAYVMGFLCWATTLGRIAAGIRLLA